MATILEKILEDGNKLKLVTWRSQIVSPGKLMYQLELELDDEIMRHPWNFEKLTEEKGQKIYDSINSKEDFESLGRYLAEK